MTQALNMPYSSKSTDEIMSRYRPIAPKPELPNNNNNGSSNSSFDAPLVPEKFRQSPYLRNIWSHLQARPTRTRKRGRTAGMSPAATAAMIRKQHQRQEHDQQQLLVGGGATFMGFPHARNLSFQGFGVYGDQHAQGDNSVSDNNIVELPLLSCALLGEEAEKKSKSIDLNSFAETSGVLEEKDLLLQLQVTANCSNNDKNKNVISPRPVRPVGSSISIVGPINEDPEAQLATKSAEEVEDEVEVEALPAIVTDRGNKVRMVNSSYKELVGQPECPWLDTMVRSSSSRRISGEVMLNLVDTATPAMGNGFTCWVRIEWESEGRKNYMNAFCDAVRMTCETKDYSYRWRFHTREVSPSASKVV